MPSHENQRAYTILGKRSKVYNLGTYGERPILTTKLTSLPDKDFKLLFNYNFNHCTSTWLGPYYTMLNCPSTSKR